jgi:dCTP deaminase
VILSGKAIADEIRSGGIRITPFNEDQLNPVSYDLTLGDDVIKYCACGPAGVFLDAQVSNAFERYTMVPEGFILTPGEGYLMHTRERIWSDRFVPVIDGKSSIGRLFVQVHQTAGFGDPGFDGQYTLEVTVKYRTRLYPGMRIAQVRFHTIVGSVEQYAGNYTGEAAEGPVASKSYKQFK